MASPKLTSSEPEDDHDHSSQALPPIRTVLGEELALPALPSSHSSHSGSSRSSVPTASWEAHDPESDNWYKRRSTGSTSWSNRSGEHWGSILSAGVLPVQSGARIQQRPRSLSGAAVLCNRSLPRHSSDVSVPLPYASSRSLPPSPVALGTPEPQAQSGVGDAADISPWADVNLPRPAPPYSYNVLRPSPSGELITAPSLSRSRPKLPRTARDQLTSSTSGSGAHSSSSRRHVCPTCQKRFNRPSSLRTHQSVHTGFRPFICLYPGCGRTFSVASNMRRHLRKHSGSSSTSGPELDTGHESVGSSEGELEMDVDDEPASELIPSGLPTPGTYFEWTAVPDATYERVLEDPNHMRH
ncbi:hypothetical protein K439DRAFT_1613240 [Ramaria rubella]|nr:hypothetical protein K439DRAFT_1613240 [Ramaria rubella]